MIVWYHETQVLGSTITNPLQTVRWAGRNTGNRPIVEFFLQSTSLREYINEHITTVCPDFGYMEVSWNGVTPKSSIYMSVSLMNHPFWVPHLWKHHETPCLFLKKVSNPTLVTPTSAAPPLPWSNKVRFAYKKLHSSTESAGHGDGPMDSSCVKLHHGHPH